MPSSVIPEHAQRSLPVRWAVVKQPSWEFSFDFLTCFDVRISGNVDITVKHSHTKSATVIWIKIEKLYAFSILYPRE